MNSHGNTMARYTGIFSCLNQRGFYNHISAWILLAVFVLPFSAKAQVRPAASPTPLSASDSTRALHLISTRIEALLGDKALNNTSVGIAIRSVRNNKLLYSHNATAPLTPASTTKLYSTFAALYTLGGDHKVATTIYTDAEGIHNGVLNGNIFLVGAGDPLLETSDIEQLAEQIHRLGITSIKGNVYGDASFFDNITNRYEYSGDKDEVQPVAPVSALTLDHNTVTLLITSGTKAGSRARIQILPTSEAFAYTVTATVKGARRSKPRLSVQQSTGKDGKQHFAISGTIPPGRTVSYTYTTTNPAYVAAGVLLRRLESAGVAVSGKASVQPAPKTTGRQLLTASYRPLSDIISIVNKNSDNFVAEHVFKMLGGAQHSTRSTAQAALTSLHTLLSDCNIPFQNCQLNDGSGLSRRNLVSPSSLVTLLAQAWNMPFAQAFVNSFSIAGIDGTLRKRMRGTPAEGNLIGKTGTLRNVSALAGYVTTLDGEHLAFSVLFNGSNVGLYKKIENDIGELLAGFSYRMGQRELSEH